MNTETKIEWTDATWNPVRGCSRVSEGCRNCYAEAVAARFAGGTGPFLFFVRRTKDGPRWTGRVELIEEKLTEPLRRRQWAEKFRAKHGRRPRMFVNSMSDLFHEALPDEAIDRVFAVMALCPWIDFQVLTKRSERMLKYFADLDLRHEAIALEAVEIEAGSKPSGLLDSAFRLPLPNVWLGVSVEDQPSADKRVPDLLATAAAVRFVSYEPALGPVDWTPKLPKWRCHCGAEAMPLTDDTSCDCRDLYEQEWSRVSGIDWLICGGESGPNARPMHPDWARQARHQCAAAGVPFHFKQWGEWLPDEQNPAMTPEGRTLARGKSSGIRVGKKIAGRLLDGVEHNAFPEVRDA